MATGEDAGEKLGFDLAPSGAMWYVCVKPFHSY